MSRSRMAIIATTAKASLTSHRSTSPALQPARFSALRIAGTGAVVNSPGAWAWAAWAAIRASGVRPRVSAVEARIRTIAAAPSEIEEALAAGIAPSLAKACFWVGFRAVERGDFEREISPFEIATLPGPPGALETLDRVGVHV